MRTKITGRNVPCVKFCRSGRKTLANDFVSRYNIVMRSIAQTTAFDIRRIIYESKSAF